MCWLSNVLYFMQHSMTYSDNRCSRLRNIIEVDFDKGEILSQVVGLDDSVLDEIEPTQRVGSRGDLDAFL